MQNEGSAEKQILFSNVIIQQIQTDSIGGAQRLRVLYSGHEYQDIIYEEMFYSQLDEKAIGLSILMAERVTPEVLEQVVHERCLARMLSECGAEDCEFLQDLIRRGYSLFMHYASTPEEYIVIAKRLFIGREHVAPNLTNKK